MFHANINLFYMGALLNTIDGIDMIITYYAIQNYIDYITVFTSFLLDTVTSVKLAKFFKSQPEGWTPEKLWKEFFFLLQNLINVVIFAISLIPYLLFVTICKNVDIYCYVSAWQRLIIILYSYNCRRVIWRTVDQTMALVVQIRNYRKLKTIVVKPINVPGQSNPTARSNR